MARGGVPLNHRLIAFELHAMHSLMSKASRQANEFAPGKCFCRPSSTRPLRERIQAGWMY
jgi:hypothetical protein